jgi:hypothetical protein
VACRGVSVIAGTMPCGRSSRSRRRQARQRRARNPNPIGHIGIIGHSRPGAYTPHSRNFWDVARRALPVVVGAEC